MLDTQLLEMIGLRSVEVDELGQDAIVFAAHGIVLVDRAASALRQGDITSRILAAALPLMTG